MRFRVGLVYVALGAATLALVFGTSDTMRAASAAVISVADLPDTALGKFTNALYSSAADQVVDDHGLRMGSLGSDIFPGDSANEFWAVTDRGPNANPGKRTFLAPKFNPVIMYVRVQGTTISVLRSIPIVDAAGLPVTGLSNISGFDEVPWNFNGTAQDVP
ncbi:MAG: esterase-like activity of phytase family protein, partial [Vicinamibacterales bacterium]